MLKLIAFHRWIEGDALDLPFPNGCFDAITMGYGLRNVVDKEKAMQELLRVVKSGISYSSVHPQNRNLILLYLLGKKSYPFFFFFGLRF